MASTYSALKIELIATGEQSGTWGTTTNTNLGDAALGEAITGSADVNYATAADVTVTLTDANTTQTARNLRLNITESSTGIGYVGNLILGSGCQIEKFYLINNTGTGAKTVKNTSGTGISVPAGKATLVFNNGTNVVDAATYFSSLTLGSALPIASGGTGSTSTTYASLTANVTGTLPVANGGTGAASATAYAVQCGGTTSTGAHQSIASVGTAAQVLTSNGAGALPTFQTPAAGGTTIPSGTVMLFGQTAAPTGFTKLTTQDDAALRVVSGTASTGGSVGFTTAFASQTPAGSVSITAVAGTAGDTTLTTPQIPSHQHKFANNIVSNSLFTPYAYGATSIATSGAGATRAQNVGPAGGGGVHSHPFSFSSGSGTFSGSAINLAVKYVDVIRATKD